MCGSATMAWGVGGGSRSSTRGGAGDRRRGCATRAGSEHSCHVCAWLLNASNEERHSCVAHAVTEPCPPGGGAAVVSVLGVECTPVGAACRLRQARVAALACWWCFPSLWCVVVIVVVVCAMVALVHVWTSVWGSHESSAGGVTLVSRRGRSCVHLQFTSSS